MWQMVFANVLIEGWIVYPYVYSFFDQPDVVVLLSPHYGEIIKELHQADQRSYIHKGKQSIPQ